MAMQVDVLIIGQGICGTMLSWFLHKEGKSFVVIDKEKENTASKVAAGIINPVTGRRYVYTWMIDEVMPFAEQVYNDLGSYFDTKYIFHKSIIDFFPSAQMRDAFTTRITENDTYLHSYPDQNYFNPFFNYDFGCGEIKPASMVHIQLLLADWRKRLIQLQALMEEEFVLQELKIEQGFITYHNITAQKIVFCDGISGFQNPWFKALPFSPNKGEALIIECSDLPNEHLFKKGLMLVPLSEPHTFWVGSNYKWEFENDEPTEEFYNYATTVLKGWLKKPFKVLSHKAAVRPATLERRPFVGFHPLYPSIGILNGMGTKGTSLAPFFANQLAQHITLGTPIAPEADVHRFSRILSK